MEKVEKQKLETRALKLVNEIDIAVTVDHCS